MSRNPLPGLHNVWKDSRMHRTPLNNDISFTGNGLSDFCVRALPVDNVERRRWRQYCECALQDDHVVG